jgi:hypothetical protein
MQGHGRNICGIPATIVDCFVSLAGHNLCGFSHQLGAMRGPYTGYYVNGSFAAHIPDQSHTADRDGVSQHRCAFFPRKPTPEGVLSKVTHFTSFWRPVAVL